MTKFPQSFFEISAQLIPVLFLAMVVEERLQPDVEEQPGKRVMRSWLLALLLVGEVISMSVVAGGIGPTWGAASMVSCAMLGAAFLLVVPVIGREFKDGRSKFERLGHALAGVTVLVAILGTLIAVQLS